ncbi:M81 family metallopeptidase [Agrobacterium bohemicum]|uniref:Microcystinase C n=1 Tax=Agrobacterium bohemicum TaxID=2052828 RepID=A0A135NY97_9HYPH|nr:M81 family metallopeptidase [Agrobacterium bohemicum]KXG84106.1 microcystin LR degradation protein MlrC-like protein [Agrobacterium bohemicum]
MKVFISTLATETNTFSPFPSVRESFTTREYFRGDGGLRAPVLGNIPLIEWRRLATSDGDQVVESICAFAAPAGKTQRTAYEGLRDEILEDLQKALPVDKVLLFLHGAMVAEGYDDCEGDIIARVRETVGPSVPIGVEIDLHCHLTELMRTKADIIVAFKEYPHTDIAERAREVYDLVGRTLAGEIRPVMALEDCRMIGVWRPPTEPMRSFVTRMSEAEGHDGILSVSFGHGFPWADVADVGAKMLVVADNDMKAAVKTAERFRQELWDIRDLAAQRYDTVEEAISAALSSSAAPIVFADVADNAGAGAAADNTNILRGLIDRKVENVAIGCFWDPVAVQMCLETGVGGELDLRVGGKMGPQSGDPVDLRVTVMGIKRDHSQPALSGGRMSLGTGVWVNGAEIDIVLTSTRLQTHSPEAFTALGCELTDKKIIVVKSMQHFLTGFGPLAAEVRYVDAGGSASTKFATLPYSKKRQPYWPASLDPFQANAGYSQEEVR